MPSNPLRKILDRRGGEAGNPSEEALEKLERGIRESRQAVRRQNEGLARGYFEDSIRALRQQVEESRATLEGLPEHVPGGEEEAFGALIGELTEGYARIEGALDEAVGNAADAETEGSGGSEDQDTEGRETEETGEDASEDVVPDGALAAVEIGEEAAQEVVGAEQVAGGEGDAEEPKASEAARRKADELGVDLSEVEGTGSGGAITVRDVTRLVESAGGAVEGASDQAPEIGGGVLDGASEMGEETGGEPRATNAARRRAEELGVDLNGIEGSGADGLITIQDVVGL